MASVSPPWKGWAVLAPVGCRRGDPGSPRSESGDKRAFIKPSRVSGISKGADWGIEVAGKGASESGVGSGGGMVSRSGSSVFRNTVNTSGSLETGFFRFFLLQLARLFKLPVHRETGRGLLFVKIASIIELFELNPLFGCYFLDVPLLFRFLGSY